MGRKAAKQQYITPPSSTIPTDNPSISPWTALCRLPSSPDINGISADERKSRK